MANILTFFRIFISLIIPVSFWFIFKYIINQEREIYILFILVLFIFAHYQTLMVLLQENTIKRAYWERY